MIKILGNNKMYWQKSEVKKNKTILDLFDVNAFQSHDNSADGGHP